jgi:hypothetical protein
MAQTRNLLSLSYLTVNGAKRSITSKQRRRAASMPRDCASWRSATSTSTTA